MVKRTRRTAPREAFPVYRFAGFEVTFPDLVTALNLCAGVAAIFTASAGEPLAAVALVAAGMLFDFFDGRIARAYGLAHDFGRELDSLADVVTFGLAPGVIALVLYPGDDLVLMAAALYAVAAAFRLARFNLHAGGDAYAGVPVPVAAFALLAGTFFLPGYGLAVLALVLAGLMLSTLRVPKP